MIIVMKVNLVTLKNGANMKTALISGFIIDIHHGGQIVFFSIA